MCPISNIVPAENVRMPGGNDGARRSWHRIRITRPTSTMRNDGGARKTRIIGSITVRGILHTGGGIANFKNIATK